MKKTSNLIYFELLTIFAFIFIWEITYSQTIGDTRSTIETKMRASGYHHKEELETASNDISDFKSKFVAYYITEDCYDIYYFTETGNVCIRNQKVYSVDYAIDIIKELNTSKELIRLETGKYKSKNNFALFTLEFKTDSFVMTIEPVNNEEFFKKYSNKGIF